MLQKFEEVIGASLSFMYHAIKIRKETAWIADF
jgi:hypothetical protein